MIQLYTDKTVTLLQANAIVEFPIYLVFLNSPKHIVGILLITGVLLLVYFQFHPLKILLIEKMLLNR